MCVNVFVYGSLMPGQSRWSSLEPFAAGSPRAAQVPGRVYRTPYGWPAAVFDPACEDLIPGVAVALEPAEAEAALSVLDAIEGVAGGLFERVNVTDQSGDLCWSYHWHGDTAGFERIPAWAPS
jgi:gamma-glutamylcyclotransferase (GGCT)/AIG2-like uncharacterized protein YtfP